MGAYWSESRSYVGVDLRSGADAAMRHLIDRKHKKIAYLAPYDSDLISAGPRFESYSFEMKSQGLSPQIVSVNSAHFPDVFETLKFLESSGKMPSAILCMNDDLAISAVHALTKLGFSVGKDVDIIGFDGIEEGQYCATPITTVRQPIDDMCELAMKFIQKQLANPNEPLMQQILTPELVIRESTGK
jgi:LacI family transcriptional regulator